ncbi:MAG: hypothetical protein IT572_05745 [Deltaproteobacteria bacterium]|nr:hypothetical protein [Deltaproteobacteria bacterium]
MHSEKDAERPQDPKEGRTFPQKDKDMGQPQRPEKRKEQGQIRDPDLESEDGPGEERHEDPERDQDQSLRRFERSPRGSDPNVR